MNSTRFLFRAMLLSFLSLMTMRAASLYAASPIDGQDNQMPSAAGAPAIDVRGTWSGTFYSNHSGVAPSTMTVVINTNSRGRIVASSALTSHCLKSARLEITVTGSEVVLAGSDKDGNNMTLRGSLDNTGTQLKSTYILNGSATGGCETDEGTVTLSRR